MSIDLSALASESLTRPRAAARRLVSLNLSASEVALVALAVTVVSALVAGLLGLILPPTGDAAMDMFLGSPLQMAVMQLLGLVLMSALVTGIGRLFGGQGPFIGAALLVAWMQALMIAVQLVQILLLLIFPSMANIWMLGGFAILIWLLASFAAELHGFASVPKVAAVIMLISFALAIVLTVALGPIATAT